MRRAQQDRERLLQSAIAASDRERRTIAAGLHDGIVQELAGHSFEMAAAAEQEKSNAELRQVLTTSAAGTRNAIRQLRSMLLEIYPPALRDHGLAAALPDAVAPLSARGVNVTVDVKDGIQMPAEIEQLVFRAAQEAIRNAGAHAAACNVEVLVTQNGGTVRLRVSDDGRGFAEDDVQARRAEGHLGLAMLRDLAEAAGGTLTVTSEPGSGTAVELEVPTS
jgi:signal transduction histidine kinase